LENTKCGFNRIHVVGLNGTLGGVEGLLWQHILNSNEDVFQAFFDRRFQLVEAIWKTFD
jgi:hypothetical protein